MMKQFPRSHSRNAAFLCAVGAAAAVMANQPSLPGASVVDGALIGDAADGTNWPSYGRTYDEGHYSPLTEINTGTVDRLRLAWSYDMDVAQRSDSQPLEAGGVLYVVAGLSMVHALDARTGALLWKFDPQVAAVAGDKLRPSWGVRGLALWKGNVLFATQDGRLMAVDGETGKQVWSTPTLPADDEATITGAPRVFGDKVVIGSAGAERSRIRGMVSAYDARTGAFLWRFHTVPGDPAKGFENAAMAMAAKTWSGEWWKFGGGGTVWNAMTYDPETDRLYIGTGNGGPWNYRIRNPKGGDALFLASIVALDAKTGTYVWHHQQNPNESWDYNATMDMQMATLTVDGRPRKVLMQAPKNGFFFVLDRETGKLISADKIAKVTWASGYDLKTGRPIEAPGIRYDKPILQWPGTFGAHNWQPMAYSPKARLVFIPTIRTADVYATDGIDPKSWQPETNGWNSGLGFAVGAAEPIHVPVETFGSTLQAWDPVAQRAAWSVPTPGIINGGAMATAGDLVFQGLLNGDLTARDTRSGKLVWRFPAGVSVLGAPISYSVGGRQYVTVIAGPPSGSPAAILPQQAAFGWRYRDHPRRILTFMLDGQGKLPATPPPGAEMPLKSTALKFDARMAAAGGVSFNKNCLTCHGVGAVASGAAPDLRASAVVLEGDAFREIVKNGALLERGMPRFAELSDADLLNLRQYVRQQASGAVVPAKAAGNTP